MMRRPPKFVQGFVDRHGKPRFYFRRPGFPRIPLPGLPWSPQFMATYGKIIATEKPLLHIGADRVIPRSIRALAIAYYDSAAFEALKPITQGVYRNIIDRFCRDTDKGGEPFGDKSAVTMTAHNVERLMALRADKPESANGLRKVLREMMKVAVKLEWRDNDPTLGVKKIKPKNTGGFHRWTESELAKFAERHAVGSKAFLAMALGLYFGQARQDVILMGEQYISREYDPEQDREVEILNWVRRKTADKTGLELAIPVHPELRRIIAATPSGHLTFLVNELGSPFTAGGFGNWFRDRCNEAGLPHCAFHGLRKAAATRLIDAGCDVVEAAAITGHASLKELQRYIETRDRKKAARRAMRKYEAMRIESERRTQPYENCQTQLSGLTNQVKKV
jgi:integrase